MARSPSSARAADDPLIFLVAGEASGDALGGRLMGALRAQGGGVRFAGIGGPRMGEQGLGSLFPMAELSVMGLAEVLPHLPRILGRLRETAAAIRTLRPAALVTIDSPAFGLRLARRAHGLGVPTVHYVAPTVWAWRPRRAAKIARFLDHLLAVLPFEPPYFERHGLRCTFVGHPVIESGADRGDGPAFRRRFGLGDGTPLLCVLPGSRMGEVSRLLPVFGEVVARLRATRPHLTVVVPTLSGLRGAVSAVADAWSPPALVVEGEDDKFGAFAAADAALAASGTVALELALAGTPAAIAYRLSPPTAAVVRRLIRVRYANLVNILLDREAVPEFLQERCRPDLLAAAIAELLDEPAKRAQQRAAATEALRRLGLDGPAPSARAAQVVLDVLRRYTDGGEGGAR